MIAASRRQPLHGPLRLLLPAIVLAAFLTGVKFIPGIRNNVGPFEIVGGLLIAYFFVFARGSNPVEVHPLLKVIFAIFAVASLSQINLPSSHQKMGLIQVLILAFLFLFLLALHNLARRFRITPDYVLQLITYSILVIGPWVIVSGVQAGGDIQAAGPFRNRAHMASYMLTAFWMVLAYALWPKIRTRDRYVAYTALTLTLYAVAVSGRRSVYLSLIVGLVGLAAAFASGHPGKRSKVFISGAFVMTFLALFYVYGGAVTPQAAFFQKRVGMIGDRLRTALSPAEKLGADEGFFVLQRQGVRLAFNERPVLGIGWGGFAKSRYSPTGHEVHSTPLRFLAELGLVGLGLYIVFMALLLRTVTSQMLRLRRTVYGPPSIAITVGLWSLAVSYLYNRHVTERTFWLLLAVVLTFEVLSDRLSVSLAPEGRRPRRSAKTRRPPRSRAAAMRLPKGDSLREATGASWPARR